MANAMTQVVVGIVAGSASALVGWYAKDYIQSNRSRGNRVERINDILEGGEEWFSTGLIEIIEEHDKQIEKMSQRIEKHEERHDKLKERVEKLQQRVKERTKRMGDDEEDE